MATRKSRWQRLRIRVKAAWRAIARGAAEVERFKYQNEGFVSATDS